MTGGTTMPGTVIVENDGADLQVGTCGDYFTVVLRNGGLGVDNRPRPTCLSTMTIPTGTSQYPVTVSASFASCDEIRNNEFPACMADGRPPPFPPGVYTAVLVEASTPPVPISVQPAVAVTIS
jgi:hypothetical protein